MEMARKVCVCCKLTCGLDNVRGSIICRAPETCGTYASGTAAFRDFDLASFAWHTPQYSSICAVSSETRMLTDASWPAMMIIC